MKDENLNIYNKLKKAKDVLKVINNYSKSKNHKINAQVIKFVDIYKNKKIVYKYCITNILKGNWVLIEFTKNRKDESGFKQYIEYISY